MTIKSYLWGMRLSTLIALFSLILVILYVDPYKDVYLAQILFFVCLFFSASGMATLALFWLRRRTLNNEAVLEMVGISFREGIIIAATVCVSLFLHSIQMLTWWMFFVVLAASLLAELWFLSSPN